MPRCGDRAPATNAVIPAQAGIQNIGEGLDARLRRHDG
jgi:hypothetical protein